MKQALAFVEANHSGGPDAYELMDNLRQAIATEESSATQEPAIWWNGGTKFASQKAKDWDKQTGGTTAFGCDIPLYTHPQPKAEQEPKREWVGLTHSDIDQGLLRSDYAFKTAEAWRAGVVFAMTKLKEKNT